MYLLFLHLVSTEGRGLTGVFASDFPLLCEQSGLLGVAVQTIQAR